MKKKNNNQQFDSFPECYGTVKKGERCPDCTWHRSCLFYKYSNDAMKSSIEREAFYPEFSEAKKIKVFADSQSPSFRLPNGTVIDPSDINLNLVLWALQFASDHPNTGKALALNLAGGKTISDIAMFNGRSRQAEHKAIAAELGIGKKKVPDSKLLTLSERDFLVYQCYSRGLSSRKTAKALNLHQTQVMRCVHFLRRKGFELCSPETKAK